VIKILQTPEKIIDHQSSQTFLLQLSRFPEIGKWIPIPTRLLAGVWALQHDIAAETREIPSYFAAGEFFIMFTLISGLVPDQ